jgi:hypothetical protein
MSAEHLHLMIVHIPVVGLACAIIPLLVGLLSRTYAAVIAGLMIAFVCGWSIFLVNQTGQQAEDRFESAVHNQIVIDQEAFHWIEVHRKDAETFSRVSYATAGVATLGLLLCVARSKWAYPIAWIVFLLCVASLVAGLMISDTGYKIRRQDFRAQMEWISPAEGVADTIHCRGDIVA